MCFHSGNNPYLLLTHLIFHTPLHFIKLLTNKAMLLTLPSYRRCQQAFSFSIDFSRFCIELNCGLPPTVHLPDVLRDVMLALALYKCHLGVAGWGGIEDSPDEQDRLRKSPLDFGRRKS